ncbi:hypothetical protein FA95DRAFT_708461 [Auriscalpium vulgare]|uniref:Uncharacterized protein n=1 Tax=Auriscalpium vulgare TaxID=40419 RepID=A0ACB8RBL3_9AGAM|nr:hypothetical protein FA95DRAFT_708461 [Auriscalpium vulgare]
MAAMAPDCASVKSDKYRSLQRISLDYRADVQDLQTVFGFMESGLEQFSALGASHQQTKANDSIRQDETSHQCLPVGSGRETDECEPIRAAPYPTSHQGRPHITPRAASIELPRPLERDARRFANRATDTPQKRAELLKEGESDKIRTEQSMPPSSFSRWS